MDIFIELSVILLLATVVSFVMKLLKQPLVVGYILTGVIAGPYVLNILHSEEYIELFAKIGIAILLFIVGLGLNPTIVKEVGKTAVVTGVGQVVSTALIGFFLVKFLGYNTITSIYAAIALTFSSTIIILKLLSDKGDVNKLYGKISIGFLLVQDIIAMLILLVVSALALTGDSSFGVLISELFVKSLTIVAILVLISKLVLPRLSHFFASSQELLFLFSLAWGLSVASLFAWIGLSIEIGALIAGVSLALSPFAYEIGSRLKPLRDYFITLFFVLLGSQLILDDLSTIIYPGIILSIFVLLGKPLLVLIIMNYLGYNRKVGFNAGLVVAQISEFSLILMAFALGLGHLTQEVVSLITIVGIITIAGSTYFILSAEQLYKRTEWFLKLFDIKRKKVINGDVCHDASDVVIFGYDRVGNDFVRAVEKLGKSYIVVDFNPSSIKRLHHNNIPHRYGDAGDVEFLQELELQCSQLIVSTVPDFTTNMVLVKTYRRLNPTGIIIVLSHNVEHTKELYLAGASYVVMPHHLGAHHAAQMVSRYGTDIEEFERERNLHLSRLAKRHA